MGSAPSGSRLAGVALIGHGRVPHLCPRESSGLAASPDVVNPLARFIHQRLTTGLESDLQSREGDSTVAEEGLPAVNRAYYGAQPALQPPYNFLYGHLHSPALIDSLELPLYF